MSRSKKLIAILCALLCVFSLSACARHVGSDDIAPHLISTPEENPVRPIDSFEERPMSDFDSVELSKDEFAARVEELYTVVVHDKKKPVFVETDPVKPIYDAARNILDTYILNSWHDGTGEYNIVHTIHDYLALNTDYDFELYDKYAKNPTEDVDDPAFSIDGVFLNKRAVCDGIVRAFCFLAAMEGIECTRETGSFDGVLHAWNRVRVDGVYYNVDITADAAYYQVGSSDYRKQLSHGFFLLSDNTIRSFAPKRHEPTDTSPIHPALTDHNYYANKTVTVGNATFSAVITDQAMLNSLFKAVSDEKGRVGKIEVKLDFEGKLYVNETDMYKSEIKEAYSYLKNPDFEMTEKQAPYFRYPNGVYLFLMYV